MSHETCCDRCGAAARIVCGPVILFHCGRRYEVTAGLGEYRGTCKSARDGIDARPTSEGMR